MMMMTDWTILKLVMVMLTTEDNDDDDHDDEPKVILACKHKHRIFNPVNIYFVIRLNIAIIAKAVQCHN